MVLLETAWEGRPTARLRVFLERARPLCARFEYSLLLPKRITFLFPQSESLMAAPARTKLAHMVYFTLADRSPAAIDKLLADCQEYLTGHPGTEYFSVGTVVPDLSRPVNDKEFDVVLNVVFTNRAAHDAYQLAERHLKFVERNKPTWAKVRVFDSYVG